MKSKDLRKVILCKYQSGDHPRKIFRDLNSVLSCDMIHKECWPVNSPDFYPSDYCIWNELVQAMDWNKIKTKLTLIAELKEAVTKVSTDVVVQSVENFTKRMYRVLQHDGDCLR
ncbi:unnamed protein product [Rotaria sp. Silwood1]|nr:unnamed protein product [Rotaria sp. Silwood1]CAF4753424.1 unnamed protein product [Rotaria sp. Silwood1]CAF4775280.1 unnamed protein product [Rotaria sp. Silwood1]CAF4879042.1 unnamed protein product [Rotaria sp. Silwood1]